MVKSSLFNRFLSFLGRVQFALVLILVGVVAMVSGTLVESWEGTEMAQSAVYRAFWFYTFLVLIGVNLIMAVINRFPLKKSQLPFLVTHLSIVLLLIGAWISRAWGYEGRLAIQEGGKENRLYLDNYQVRAKWGEVETGAGAGYKAPSAREILAPLPRTIFLAGRRLCKGGEGLPELGIVDFLPNGVESATFSKGGEGDPAGLEFSLSGRGLTGNNWLISHHQSYRRRDLGPVEVEMQVYASQALLDQRKPALDKPVNKVTLAPLGGGSPVTILLPDELHRSFPCGPGVTAKATRFLLRAQVGAKGIVDNPGGHLNPAVVVEFSGPEKKETHTLFSIYPDFNVIKGRSGKGLVGRVNLEVAAAMTKPMVSLLVGPKRDIYVQLSAAMGRGEAFPAPVGKKIGLGNMGIDLQVTRFLAQARARISYRSAVDEREGGRPCIKLAAAIGGEAVHVWLTLGGGKSLELAGRPLELLFDRQVVLLPFTVALEDFILDFHPGSKRPSAYRSKVKVAGIEPGSPSLATEIAMNRPLDFQGYRLFQSSYQLGEKGKPDVTFLSVSYDPGVEVVYLAFILIILGTGWYLKGSRSGSQRDGGGKGIRPESAE